MSEENDDINEGEGIKNLRKQYDATAKQLKDALDALSTYQAKDRQTSVAEILKAKGVPASAAKLYNGDDASEEAVGKWIEEYADVFGAAGSSGQQDQNAANAQRVANASFGNGEPVESGGKDKPTYGSPDEIQHALNNWSMEDLQKAGLMPKQGTLFNPKR